MNKKSKREFDESVHYDIKGRKRYKRKLWLVFLIMFVILIGCSVMFTFANYSWDPEKNFTPTVDPKEPYQIALAVLGGIIAVAALVGTFLYCWFDINKFYRSQEKYFKTAKFKEAKAKARAQDLTKLKVSTIKWYKKLGYITSDEKRDLIEQVKNKKSKEEKTTND